MTAAAAASFDDDADLFEADDADDALDALDLGDLDSLFEEDNHDAFSEVVDALDAELGDFALDAATGLHLPTGPRLVTGPAVAAAARRLNPAVLMALNADDADAFLRRIRRGIARVARVAAPVLRRAAPLLRRALPVVQRIASVAGPWGRVVAAGIGAARGLAEGRGLRGALAGAIGGAIPGIGGRLASMVLRGDGADDDAALDALADMADAGQVAPVIALPVGAGLASRVAVRHGLHQVGASAPPAAQAVWSQAQQAERTMLRGALAMPGSAGQRLRLLRAAGRIAAAQAAQHGTPAAAARAVPAAARGAVGQVISIARDRPTAGASTPVAAARRLAARRRLVAMLQRLMTQGL